MAHGQSFYRAHVFCCLNERAADHPRGSCKLRGAAALRDHLKTLVAQAGLGEAVRVNQAGCLDRCELGPCLVIYPEAVWYRPQTLADVERIVREHLVGGVVVEDLRLADQPVPGEARYRGPATSAG